MFNHDTHITQQVISFHTTSTVWTSSGAYYIAYVWQVVLFITSNPCDNLLKIRASDSALFGFRQVAYTQKSFTESVYDEVPLQATSSLSPRASLVASNNNQNIVIWLVKLLYLTVRKKVYFYYYYYYYYYYCYYYYFYYYYLITMFLLTVKRFFNCFLIMPSYFNKNIRHV